MICPAVGLMDRIIQVSRRVRERPEGIQSGGFIRIAWWLALVPAAVCGGILWSTFLISPGRNDSRKKAIPNRHRTNDLTRHLPVAVADSNDYII